MGKEKNIGSGDGQTTLHSEYLLGGEVVLIKLPALLPVIATKQKLPQRFRTMEEWGQIASDGGISFVQAAIEYEKNSSGWSDEKIWSFFENIAEISNK